LLPSFDAATQSKDNDGTLSPLYCGYDFAAAQMAITEANPPIGYVVRGDPGTAAVTVRSVASERGA
jgi:hypothetical protein